MTRLPSAGAALSVLAALSILLGTMTACSSSTGESAENGGASSREVVPVDVAVQTIKARLFVETLEVTGTIRPWEEVVVSAELGGLVREIGFDKGERVERGQILARVGDDLARAQLDRARADLADAEAVYEKTSKLYERQAVPEQDLIAATSRRDAVRAQVEEMRLRLERAVVRAPIAGVAIDQPVDAGEVIGPGTRVTTLHQVDRLELEAEVPDTEIAWLEPGRPAEVVVDAYPGRTFEARLHFVAPAADPVTRSFLVELELPNQDGLLRPGMVARAMLVRRTIPSGIVVPLDAIMTREDGDVTFVVEDGVARVRRVVTGAIEGDEALIASGLEEGEQLVVTGQRELVEGHPVQVEERP